MVGPDMVLSFVAPPSMTQSCSTCWLSSVASSSVHTANWSSWLLTANKRNDKRGQQESTPVVVVDAGGHPESVSRHHKTSDPSWLAHTSLSQPTSCAQEESSDSSTTHRPRLTCAFLVQWSGDADERPTGEAPVLCVRLDQCRHS